MEFIKVKIELLDGSIIEGHFVKTNDGTDVDMAMTFLADYVNDGNNPTGIKNYEVIDPIFGTMFSYGLDKVGLVQKVFGL